MTDENVTQVNDERRPGVDSGASGYNTSSMLRVMGCSPFCGGLRGSSSSGLNQMNGVVVLELVFG